MISTLPSTFCDLPEECTIKLDDNCLNESNITGSFECISDLGDQNECINMNLDIYQPSNFQLFTSFPNPFNPLTKIEYNLPYVGDVSLIIYDIMGRQVEILYNGIQYQGHYTISWDASNYSSGVYFIKMNVGDSQSPISQSQKVVLLK